MFTLGILYLTHLNVSIVVEFKCWKSARMTYYKYVLVQVGLLIKRFINYRGRKIRIDFLEFIPEHLKFDRIISGN